MYILIVARGYPSERYKMNGIFEFDQAKALAKAGHKVIYAAIDVRSIRHKRQWGFESFKKDGVQIFEKYIPKKLQNEIFNKSEIIPNGIDDFWLKNKGTPKTLSGSKINLLTVGIISKRKNQLTTTRVVKLLQSVTSHTI